MRQQELLQILLEGLPLSARNMEKCMNAIMDGEFTPAGIAAILALLQKKGVTAGEAIGAWDSIMARTTPITLDDEAVDTCGTGGDHAGTFNISTAAAILSCAAGVRIAKHGNRSVTSSCGSADVLESLGYTIDLPPEATREQFLQTGFAFLFAPMYHPSMKAVAAVRRELGIRTIFNMLGPLLNPARVKRQLIGVFDRSIMDLYTEVLVHAGCRHAMIVHGTTETGKGLDEPSVCGPTSIIELRDGAVSRTTIHPEEFGLTRWTVSELKGGDSHTNACMIRNIVDGSASRATTDAAVFAAAITCHIAGISQGIDEGVGRVKECLEKGTAAAKFQHILETNSSLAGKYHPASN